MEPDGSKCVHGISAGQHCDDCMGAAVALTIKPAENLKLARGASTVASVDVIIELPDGREIELADGDDLIVGRDSSSCSFANLFGDTVSSRHLRLRNANGVATVEDLSSTNGSFIDDERLIPGQPTSLFAGAIVRLCDKETRYEMRIEVIDAA